MKDFLDDQFEVQNYATKVIQSAAISQQLAQLFNGISMLDKELQSQVEISYVFLFLNKCFTSDLLKELIKIIDKLKSHLL